MSVLPAGLVSFKTSSSIRRIAKRTYLTAKFFEGIYIQAPDRLGLCSGLEIGDLGIFTFEACSEWLHRQLQKHLNVIERVAVCIPKVSNHRALLIHAVDCQRENHSLQLL
jgi:hypothetical protein